MKQEPSFTFPPKGVDKVPFSIRVDEENYNVIKKLAKKHNTSNNIVVNEMIKFSIKHMKRIDLDAL